MSGRSRPCRYGSSRALACECPGDDAVARRFTDRRERGSIGRVSDGAVVKSRPGRGSGRIDPLQKNGDRAVVPGSTVARNDPGRRTPRRRARRWCESTRRWQEPRPPSSRSCGSRSSASKPPPLRRRSARCAATVEKGDTSRSVPELRDVSSRFAETGRETEETEGETRTERSSTCREERASQVRSPWLPRPGTGFGQPADCRSGAAAGGPFRPGRPE